MRVRRIDIAEIGIEIPDRIRLDRELSRVLRLQKHPIGEFPRDETDRARNNDQEYVCEFQSDIFHDTRCAAITEKWPMRSESFRPESLIFVLTSQTSATFEGYRTQSLRLIYGKSWS